MVAWVELGRDIAGTLPAPGGTFLNPIHPFVKGLVVSNDLVDHVCNFVDQNVSNGTRWDVVTLIIADAHKNSSFGYGVRAPQGWIHVHVPDARPQYAWHVIVQCPVHTLKIGILLIHCIEVGVPRHGFFCFCVPFRSPSVLQESQCCLTL